MVEETSVDRLVGGGNACEIAAPDNDDDDWDRRDKRVAVARVMALQFSRGEM